MIPTPQTRAVSLRRPLRRAHPTVSRICGTRRNANSPMRVKSCRSARSGRPNAPQVAQQRLEQQKQQAQLSCSAAGPP